LALVDADEVSAEIAGMKLIEPPSGFAGRFSATVFGAPDAPIEIRRGPRGRAGYVGNVRHTTQTQI
jgi:hypothetical protein